MVFGTVLFSSQGYGDVALPDPLLLADGQRVQTRADWVKRREEIKAILLREEYGRMPPAPENVKVAEASPVEVQNDGATHFQRLRLTMGTRDRISVQVERYFPAGKGPFPVIVRVGLGCPVIGDLNKRGYALVCFEHRDLDPETEGSDTAGPAQLAYPEYDWGSVGVWAWGASRVLDYVLTLPETDSSAMIVTGHSRTGKAALLAGALDERFAMVAPNGSGCGGVSCYRYQSKGSEDLESITRPSRFASWFQKDFRRYAGHEDTLPFDQHFLRALVAPRMMLSTDALGDIWANPLGNQAGYFGAQPVFDFLDAPESNQMHFREGDHDQLGEDFMTLVDAADWYFEKKAKPEGLTTLPVEGFRP